MILRLTAFGKFSIVLLICGLLFGAYKTAQNLGWIKPKEVAPSTVIEKVELPDAPKNANSTVEPVNAPQEKLAKLSLKKNITKIVFDRGPYLYHGRIKALADGARAGGLQF